ncbi:hypothetical protein Peur_029910 [Populus x canadensis]
MAAKCLASISNLTGVNDAFAKNIGTGVCCINNQVLPSISELLHKPIMILNRKEYSFSCYIEKVNSSTAHFFNIMS